MQCNTNAQNLDLTDTPGRILEALIAFCSESSGILTAAHFKALDMYQVGVPMTTSSCLTTKPNFL
jgi:hypothetical protein